MSLADVLRMRERLRPTTRILAGGRVVTVRGDRLPEVLAEHEERLIRLENYCKALSWHLDITDGILNRHGDSILKLFSLFRLLEDLVSPTPKLQCSTTGCDGNPKASGGARGLCPKCYRRACRKEEGATPSPVPYTPKGEGDEVTFRLPADEKAAVAKLARRLKLPSPSELHRQIVRAFLELGPELQESLIKH